VILSTTVAGPTTLGRGIAFSAAVHLALVAAALWTHPDDLDTRDPTARVPWMMAFATAKTLDALR
jgi:predicted membrane metal-binding protein